MTTSKTTPGNPGNPGNPETPSSKSQIPNPKSQILLSPSQELHGFVVRTVTDLPNLRAHAYFLDHPASGARLIHVHGPDTENLFSITFPTPAPDDSGVPHILEHGVLAGSRKFPVKEPFFEMVKMSMATFINAMTADAFTVYPVASNVRKDFFNLAEVYCDAVFHPLLTRDIFEREGHHLALAKSDDPTSDLIVKGIVYNEMKGAYSNPEALVGRKSNQELFPDVPLGRDSGGDPEHIPELTLEAFRHFHQTLYHPSNALIFIYGDIPTATHLEFLRDKLAGFTRQAAPPILPHQPRWTQPRRHEHSYPIGPTEETKDKAYLTLGWALGDATDPADATAWGVLDRLLLGNEAAPLKKALIDSRLGADTFMTGASDTAHEGVFHVGLKGSQPERADAFLELVLRTFQEIADRGFTKEQVDAAFQQLAYHHLEIATLFPMRLLWATNATWPYGGDPLTFLRMDVHLEDCRKRYEADPALFTRMIRQRLIENPHRLLSIFTPDPALAARTQAAFEERMKARKATFSEAQLRAIGTSAAELEAAQGKPNSPEALASLPQLQVSDLPAGPRHIPTTIEKLDTGVELLRNDVFANGINYLHLDFNLEGLPTELYPYLPRFVEAFSKLGAAGQPFTSIAERRAAHTGGLGCWYGFYTHATDPARSLRRMGMSVRMLDRGADNALALMHDLLFGLDPHDHDRLRDVITQSRARIRTGLVNDGSGTALRRAARGLSAEAALNESVAGLAQLALVETLSGAFDTQAEGLMTHILAIRDFLLVRGRVTASFTGSAHVYDNVARRLSQWTAAMRDEPVRDARPQFQPYSAPPREGLAGPMEVAYCAMAMPAPHGSHPDAPLLALAARLASLEYVLTEVRFKGNAYGAGCHYGESQRTFGFHSYRDPRLAQTLAVFNGLKDFVNASTWTQTDIDRAIIGAAKTAETPIRPGEATGTALGQHVRGATRAYRENWYRRLLSATPASVKRVLLEQLEQNQSKAAVCVVSSRAKLEAANQELGAQSLAIEDIIKK